MNKRWRWWWAWVSDPNHQRSLSFLGAGVAAAAIAGWTVYVHLSDELTAVAPPGVSASNGGIAGDVTAKAGPGGTAIVATGPVTISGISLEQYEAGLKRKEQEVREELARTHRDDKEKVALLEKELAAVQAKLQNLEQALSEYRTKLAEASQALEKLKGDLPADQLAEARQALVKGDTAAAEALFTEALAQGKAQAAAGNEKAADAAFQLGHLAYQRIDYARAYDYYLEAAKLQPDNPEYLNRTGLIAHDLGRYAEAHTFFEKALRIREVLGPEHPDVSPEPQQPGGALRCPRAVREGRAAPSARARRLGEGFRSRTSRCGHRPQQPGGALSRARPACEGRAPP